MPDSLLAEKTCTPCRGGVPPLTPEEAEAYRAQAPDLMQGDEAPAFADKAYDTTGRREALAEAGVADGTMHRGHPRRRLAPWQRWMNVALSPIRGQVEQAFGTLKRNYGWRRVRYRGLAHNGGDLQLLCCALNLRRAVPSSPAVSAMLPSRAAASKTNHGAERRRRAGGQLLREQR